VFKIGRLDRSIDAFFAKQFNIHYPISEVHRVHQIWYLLSWLLLRKDRDRDEGAPLSVPWRYR